MFHKWFKLIYYRVYVNGTYPVSIFVSKMLKFTYVISNFFFLILYDQFCSRSKGKKLWFKCSTDLQNFRIYFRKFRASLPLPFGFRYNSFRPRCWELMLSFSMYSDCKTDKYLLTLHIVKFAFPSSRRMPIWFRQCDSGTWNLFWDIWFQHEQIVYNLFKIW